MKKLLSICMIFALLTVATVMPAFADMTTTSSASNTMYGTVSVYNINSGTISRESIPIGRWTVTALCYYLTTNTNAYPQSASVQGYTFTAYKSGKDADTTAVYTENSSFIMENGNRVKVTLYSTCPVMNRYAQNASKLDNNVDWSEYDYSDTSTSVSDTVSVTINFYKY